jgi:large subunit ribosomal protein L6
MSRVGNKPVAFPSGVTVTVGAQEFTVKGPKGELRQQYDSRIKIAVDNAAKQAVFTRDGNQKEARALHGLYRSLMNNMIIGVTQGYERRLRIVGTGYRVELTGKTLVIQAGYCHPVHFTPVAGVEIELPKSTSREYMDFIVRGIDKQKVMEAAAQLRRVRPPDLYKGKGIRYGDEKVRRLEGKSFASA